MAQIASLVVRVSAQISEFQKSFKEISDQTAKTQAEIAKSTEAMNQSVAKFGASFEGAATRAAAFGTVIGNAASSMARTVASSFGAVITDSVRLSQEFNNAFIGLGSVAAAFGQDVGKVKEAAKALSADGLLPLKDSATGLKNLLAAGFGLDQSVKLMEAFKDSAAFGRQSALSFGDAVRSATEGVKNGNSTLVDNAGVTKNLSVILKEAGFQMQDLADKTKGVAARQALYNGILRETAAQQGDAAKAANTYTGQLTALQTAYETLLATWGDAITQNKTVADTLGAVGAALRAVTGASTDNHAAFNFVSDAVIIMVKSFAVLVEALDKTQHAFRGTQKWLLEYVISADTLIIKWKELALAVDQNSPFAKPEDLKASQDAINELKDERNRAILQVAEANQKEKEFGQTLQVVADKTRQLAADLALTRGQVVDLGTSGPKAGADLAGGLEKAKKAAKDTTTEINAVWKEVEALNARVQKFDTDAMAKEFKELAREAKADIDSLDQRVQRFQRSTDDAADRMKQELFELNIPLPFIGFSQAQIQSLGLVVKPAAEKAVTPFRDAFTKLGQELPQLISRGFQQGGTLGAIAAVADASAKEFSGIFKAGMERTGGVFDNLKIGEKFAAYGAIAAQSFTSGFAQGVASPSAESGIAAVFAGVVSGALTAGVGGAVVGGGLALAGFLVGAQQNAAEARRVLDEAKAKLLLQFHNMDTLLQQATRSGFHLGGQSTADSINALFDAPNAATFNRDLIALNHSLDIYQEHLKAIDSATAGVNARTAVFANRFAPLVAKRNEALEKQKTSPGDSVAASAAKDAQEQIQELAQRTQPEFERLGLFVRDAFSAMVKASGNAIQAITALAPSFQLLKDGITDFGLTSTGVITALVGSFDLVNNEAFKPFFENIAATGQVLSGLLDAKALNRDTFQAAAADIGQSIQEIINRGGDMAATLALSAPQLQTLWEAQQKYGAVTDQTTQSILNQAVQQGIVGEQFKSTNDKILDVLLAIADVFHADIPDGLRAMAAASKTAAQDVTDNLSKIQAPEIKIPVSFESDDPRVRFFGEAPEPRPMAVGGIVTRPTLALVGEAGPEAVIPLSRLGPSPVNLGRGGDVYLDGRKVGKVMLKHVADEAMYQGLVPR